jgi:hypothetical protein
VSGRRGEEEATQTVFFDLTISDNNEQASKEEGKREGRKEGREEEVGK